MNNLVLHSRREWLKTAAGGFGYLAFASLCAEAQVRQDPLAPRAPHFPAQAKRVIFLFMNGGPSHVDTFDYKPRLQANGGGAGRRPRMALLESPWRFRQHGQSGQWVSELFPELAAQADRLCVIRGMQTDNQAHHEATLQMHTGSFQFPRPSMGAWTVYGLGSENRNLPGFISLSPSASNGCYSSACLPALYQATSIGAVGRSFRLARINNLQSPRLTQEGQRRQLDLLQEMNQKLAERVHDDRLDGMLNTFEMAFRMQSELPTVMNLTDESRATLDLYGIDAVPTDDFGRQCLTARRLAEAGVRFIELSHSNWDHHRRFQTELPLRCREIDKPIAGLLIDLERRGLLDETLVVWGGEFGRTPDDYTRDGRGHNNKGFTMWLAGGGIKGGLAYGATDEYGYEAVTDKVHLHDLHATLLHQLGLDHERLTYLHSGREVRLTDDKGTVVRNIIA
jgi:hypothetical protein